MLHRLTLAAAVVSLALLTTGVSAQQDETDSETNTAAVERRIENWLRRQDKDNDGQISVDEATGLMKTNFARNDSNEDGILDDDELRDLSERLQRNSQQPTNEQRRRQQTLSTRQLLARAPEGVVIEPDIAYREGDSDAWRLDLIRPESDSDEPRPGLVFVHGGGWRNGDKRTGTFLSGALEYAQLGYVCITVNYRLLDEAPFPACIEDVKNAVRWFRAHADQYNVASERIGGYGNSAGAHLVCMLGLAGPDAGLEGDGPYQEQSSLLQAVCASATPTEFLIRSETPERRRRASQTFAGPIETLEERARQASPITYAAATAPPMLLFHGTADGTVDVAHSDRFTQALEEARADDVTYIRIDDAGHGVFNQHADTTKPAMREFFDRTIGPGSISSE